MTDALPRSEVTAVTLEFGTYPPTTVLRALQVENWLHHHGGSNHPRGARIKAGLRRAFVPADDGWQRTIYQHGRDVVEQALAGLARR